MLGAWATSSPHPTSSGAPPPPPRWRPPRPARRGPPAGRPTRCRWPTAARGCSRRSHGERPPLQPWPGRSVTPVDAEWRMVGPSAAGHGPDGGDRVGPGHRAGPPPLPRRRRSRAGLDHRGGAAGPRRGGRRGAAGRGRRRGVGHHRRRLGGGRGHRRPGAARAGGAGGGLRRGHAVPTGGRGLRPPEGRHPRPGGGPHRPPRTSWPPATAGTWASTSTRCPEPVRPGGWPGGWPPWGRDCVPGFDLVADLVGLPERLARADLVVTGEGRLDPTSFEGKVVGASWPLVGGPGPGPVRGRRRRPGRRGPAPGGDRASRWSA